MEFIRPLDDSKVTDLGFPGYRAQFLSHLESALILASHVEGGGSGPGLHYHHADQFYFLLAGTMTVQLGDDVHRAPPGSLVFIPAGLPHRNWNEGPGTETHFEMIVPSPRPGGERLALPVDSVDAIPAGDRTEAPGVVSSADPDAFSEPVPGFRIQRLAGPGSGSHRAVVNYAEVDPGRSGPGMHIHHFDQYYLVLEGELTIEVALETHVVGPTTLVVLPAGVPHRQHNEAAETERHLAILTPAPVEGRPMDVAVTFAPTGEAI